MTSLTCISILESGSFNSDSGNVVKPAGGVTFPIEALAVGAAMLSFSASGTSLATIIAAGSASMTFAAAGVGSSDAVADGSASITFSASGDSNTADSLLTEGDDHLLLESGDRILLEG